MQILNRHNGSYILVLHHAHERDLAERPLRKCVVLKSTCDLFDRHHFPRFFVLRRAGTIHGTLVSGKPKQALDGALTRRCRMLPAQRHPLPCSAHPHRTSSQTPCSMINLCLSSYGFPVKCFFVSLERRITSVIMLCLSLRSLTTTEHAHSRSTSQRRYSFYLR